MLLLKVIWVLFKIVLIAAIIMAVIASFVQWIAQLGKEYPWLKFKDFLNLYNDNPNEWRLCSDGVQYKKPSENGWSYYSNYICCKFNYIDFVKYKFWMWNTERQNKKKETRTKYEEHANILQANIQKFNQENGIEVVDKRSALKGDWFNAVKDKFKE